MNRLDTAPHELLSILSNMSAGRTCEHSRIDLVKHIGLLQNKMRASQRATQAALRIFNSLDMSNSDVYSAHSFLKSTNHILEFNLARKSSLSQFVASMMCGETLTHDQIQSLYYTSTSEITREIMHCSNVVREAITTFQLAQQIISSIVFVPSSDVAVFNATLTWLTRSDSVTASGRATESFRVLH